MSGGAAADDRARNVDPATVSGFGSQWLRFHQGELPDEELRSLFEMYFRIFPWDELPEGAIGLDLGCGTGRWARLVAPRVGRLLCLDASPEAARVAAANLADAPNGHAAAASVDAMPVEDATLDFGYSLGVLHHVPDTLAGLRACQRKLKPGAPFLVYLYYAFDNRPWWFGFLWSVADAVRRIVSRLPGPLRYAVSQIIAFTVYWPVARISRLWGRLGLDVDGIPMSGYRDRSLYTLRTDALDRFGTRLVQRFTADEVRGMMREAGFERVELSDEPPYWTALGYATGE